VTEENPYFWEWNEDESMVGDFPFFVDKQGQPMSRAEAMAAFVDDERRRIGGDEVRGHWVSTVWLVLNHGFESDVPIPFETMIFCHHGGECVLADYQERYPTEEAARAGHDRALAEARDAACGTEP
jgi:hypothetical protein